MMKTSTSEHNSTMEEEIHSLQTFKLHGALCCPTCHSCYLTDKRLANRRRSGIDHWQETSVVTTANAHLSPLVMAMRIGRGMQRRGTAMGKAMGYRIWG